MQALGTKGTVSTAELHAIMEDMDMRGRKALGAKIVARAWVDPAFKGRLLDNAAAAAEELGIASSNFPPAPGATLRVASETEGPRCRPLGPPGRGNRTALRLVLSFQAPQVCNCVPTG